MRMRVDESSNSRSHLAWNSHTLASTLMSSHWLWTSSNFSSDSQWEFSLIWPELMIVHESWRKLSWESTPINFHPDLAHALVFHASLCHSSCYFATISYCCKNTNPIFSMPTTLGIQLSCTSDRVPGPFTLGFPLPGPHPFPHCTIQIPYANYITHQLSIGWWNLHC